MRAGADEPRVPPTHPSHDGAAPDDVRGSSAESPAKAWSKRRAEQWQSRYTATGSTIKHEPKRLSRRRFSAPVSTSVRIAAAGARMGSPLGPLLRAGSFWSASYTHLRQPYPFASVPAEPSPFWLKLRRLMQRRRTWTSNCDWDVVMRRVSSGKPACYDAPLGRPVRRTVQPRLQT